MKKLLMLVFFAVIFTGLCIAGSITVNSPNGGEVWTKGHTENISWNSSGLTNLVKISLWKNGVFVGVIVKDQPKNGTFPWVVGTFIGGTAKCASTYTINVREQGGAEFQTQDFSDENFTIDGCLIPDHWKDLLKKLRRVRWPWPPEPGCPGCPPEFKWDKLREIMREIKIKEELTFEIIRGSEVFGKAVRGKVMRGVKVMPQLRVARLQKFNKAKEEAFKDGKGFKLRVKNAKGEVVFEQEMNVERAARR